MVSSVKELMNMDLLLLENPEVSVGPLSSIAVGPLYIMAKV